VNISTKLGKKITVYAIGGTAMMFQGFKEVTLDIDLVFDKEEDKLCFKKAAMELGYKSLDPILIYGGRKDIPEMLKLDDERFDLFVNHVIEFDFSKEMMQRSGQIHQFGSTLLLKIANPQDIILMKCATDRKKDMDDARNIMETTKIDWTILIEEAKNQIRLGRHTAAFELGEFLEKLKYEMKMDIPKKALASLFEIARKQAEEKQYN